MKWFPKQVISWAQTNGRTGLPWQTNRTPYSVWVSEVMLQQTQVQTVIPYFERFMALFPTVRELAGAPEEQVLACWSGLGYYRRAKNLHRATQQVMDQFEGELPNDIEALVTLPGIGRSTAGAILACGFSQRGVILDGNVKRVLARFDEVDGDPNRTVVSKKLWELADVNTPNTDCDQYVQGIMDLGATICTKSDPSCGLCPLKSRCKAHRSGTIHLYPMKKSQTKVRKQTISFVLLVDSLNHYLLEQQPEDGLWASLYLPISRQNTDDLELVLKRVGVDPKLVLKSYELEDFTYVLTHRRLGVQAEVVHIKRPFIHEQLLQRCISFNQEEDLPSAVPKLTQRLIDRAKAHPSFTFTKP